MYMVHLQYSIKGFNASTPRKVIDPGKPALFVHADASPYFKFAIGQFSDFEKTVFFMLRSVVTQNDFFIISAD